MVGRFHNNDVGRAPGFAVIVCHRQPDRVLPFGFKPVNNRLTRASKTIAEIPAVTGNSTIRVTGFRGIKSHIQGGMTALGRKGKISHRCIASRSAFLFGQQQVNRIISLTKSHGCEKTVGCQVYTLLGRPVTISLGKKGKPFPITVSFPVVTDILAAGPTPFLHGDNHVISVHRTDIAKMIGLGIVGIRHYPQITKFRAFFFLVPQYPGGAEVLEKHCMRRIAVIQAHPRSLGAVKFQVYPVFPTAVPLVWPALIGNSILVALFVLPDNMNMTAVCRHIRVFGPAAQGKIFKTDIIAIFTDKYAAGSRPVHKNHENIAGFVHGNPQIFNVFNVVHLAKGHNTGPGAAVKIPVLDHMGIAALIAPGRVNEAVTGNIDLRFIGVSIGFGQVLDKRHITIGTVFAEIDFTPSAAQVLGLVNNINIIAGADFHFRFKISKIGIINYFD